MTDSRRSFAVASAVLSASLSVALADQEAWTYRGTSDASAGAPVGDDAFIVGDDENNVLRVYKVADANSLADANRIADANTPSAPIASCDLTEFLQVDPDYPEADIEGAAPVGDRVYWITSHGRSDEGKDRPSRHRFFATTVHQEKGKVEIRTVGTPCKTLARAMADHPALRKLGLDKAVALDEKLKKAQRKELAPKEKGLNIEALSASADGNTLYIGLRNPLVAGEDGKPRALLIPLSNPPAVIEKGERPTLGAPILWDMAGMGFRDMEYCPYHKAHFVLAGWSDSRFGCRLFRWSGAVGEPPKLVREIDAAGAEYQFEALICFPGSPKMLILSDDGTRPVKVSGPAECLKDGYRPDGTCLNKHVADANRKTFRGVWTGQ